MLVENNIEHFEKDAEKGLKKGLKMIRKVRKKTKIIIGIILVIVLVIIGCAAFKKKEPAYQWVEAIRGDVIEEISVAGTIKPAEDVDLRFETSGTVEKIYVSKGQEVKQGSHLVKLYTGKVYSQFLQTQASYNQAKAELDQFIAGASAEEIQVAERIVENARIAFKDAKTKAENDLIEDYNNALDAFDNAYFNADKAMKQLETIFDENTLYEDYRSDLSFRDIQAKTDAKDKKSKADTALENLKELVMTMRNNPSHNEIDNAFSFFLSYLKTIRAALDSARNLINLVILHSDYSQTQWDTDRANIETGRTAINTAITNTISVQQAVASQKVTNQINVNSAENTLAKAEADLEEKLALPRGVDIAVYQAKVDKAKASVAELQQKLNDAVLKSPINGVISRINTKIGEIVTAGGEPAISLISANKFQIEVDIYEEDIVKIKTGNPVDISIIAFPDEILKGRVIMIGPSEKIIDKVVYYEVTIDFEEIKEGIKPMMTADLVIKTASKENVLFIPKDAIQKKNSKFITRVLKDGQIQNREIEIGLRGDDDKVEVISGLEEGEKVIIK